MTHPQLPLDAPACAARELSPEMGGASLVCSREPGHHGCHFDARTDWHWIGQVCVAAGSRDAEDGKP